MEWNLVSLKWLLFISIPHQCLPTNSWLLSPGICLLCMFYSNGILQCRLVSSSSLHLAKMSLEAHSNYIVYLCLIPVLANYYSMDRYTMCWLPSIPWQLFGFLPVGCRKKGHYEHVGEGAWLVWAPVFCSSMRIEFWNRSYSVVNFVNNCQTVQQWLSHL